MHLDKQTLRQQLGSKLRSQSPEERAEKSSAILASLTTTEMYLQAKNVFTYVSYPWEVDTRGLLTRVLEDGKTLCVPKLVNDLMVPVSISSLQDLKEGARGIWEPVSDEVYGAKIDMVVIPCIATDKEGYRLGWGKGYYDRYLAQGNYETTIILAYADQVCPSVPRETHDRKADAVLTEKGFLR